MSRADILGYLELIAGALLLAGAYGIGRELTRVGSSVLISIVS